MATGTGGGSSAFEFPAIASLISGSTPGRALPTVTLVGEADEDQEVKILVFLVRCRETGFMGILPRAEMVVQLLESLVDEDSGEPLVVFQTVTMAVLDSSGRKFGNAEVLLADFSARRSSSSQCSFSRSVQIASGRCGASACSTSSLGCIRSLGQGDRRGGRAFWGVLHCSIRRGAASGSWRAQCRRGSDSVGGSVASSHHGTGKPAEDTCCLSSSKAPIAVRSNSSCDAAFSFVRRHGSGTSRCFNLGQASRSCRTCSGASFKAGSSAQDQTGRVCSSECSRGSRSRCSAGRRVGGAYYEWGGPSTENLGSAAAADCDAIPEVATKEPYTDAITGALGSEGGNSNTNGVRGGVAREAYLRALEDVAGVGKAIMMNAATDLGLAESQIGSGLMRLSTWSDECPWAIAAY